MRSIQFQLRAATILATFWGAGLVRADPEDPQKSFPWEGEVTATNVYVRSAAGTNWYQTDKLNPGARVLVTGEKFGWYQVIPPDGSFSYIVSTKVDVDPGGKSGAVIEDKIKVFAGSHLTRDKTAVQTMLNRGDRVNIVGEADGFLKIAPPAGASLYISSKYVEFVPPNLRTGLAERHTSAGLVARTVTPAKSPAEPAPSAAQPNKPTASPGTVTQTPPATTEIKPTSGSGSTGELSTPVRTAQGSPTPGDPSADAPRPSAGVARPNAPAAVEPTTDRSIHMVQPGLERQVKGTPPTTKGGGRYEAMLTIVESELQTELGKPLTDQNLSPLLARYEEIASQTNEFIPAEIARIRVRQIGDRIQLQTDRLGFLADRVDIDAQRARLLRERQDLAKVRLTGTGADRYDLEGELRRSLAFPAEMRRFRLVDPARNSTVAYVDIPTGVSADVNQWIGRYVGIRTAGRQYSPSARVTIAVAAQIEDLTPKAPAAGSESSTPLGGTREPIPDASTPDARPQEPVVPAPSANRGTPPPVNISPPEDKSTEDEAAEDPSGEGPYRDRPDNGGG